jgi:hypothetical protein
MNDAPCLVLLQEIIERLTRLENAKSPPSRRFTYADAMILHRLVLPFVPDIRLVRFSKALTLWLMSYSAS